MKKVRRLGLRDYRARAMAERLNDPNECLGNALKTWRAQEKFRALPAARRPRRGLGDAAGVEPWAR